MASFARRWSLAAVWSVDDASTFAAQKEFKLLQLLSNDKKALAMARRLGLFCLSHTAAEDSYHDSYPLIDLSYH